VNGLNSLGVKLSDLRKNRSATTWTSDNTIVKEEPGDFYYGNEKSREDELTREFQEYQKRIKEFSDNIKSQDIKPLIYDKEGKSITRGDMPDFTQKSIIVTKSSALGNNESDINKTLEALGEQLSAMSKKDIKEAMDLKPGDVDIQGKRAVIGTFNIEWLGKKERSEEDYKEIARVIKDSKAQILGIQEVSNEKGLKQVMEHLPGYGYILGKSSNQKIAVLFDKSRVKYDINSIDQLDDVRGRYYLRSPLLINMKIDDGFDFTFVVVHLKARFDEESAAIRTEQAASLNKWIKKHLKKSDDKDVIVVGDFNDFLGSNSLKPLAKDKSFHFTTEDVKDDFYSTLPFKSLLDHALVNTTDKGSMEEYIATSVYSIDENKYPNYKDRVSNHKPVLFQIRSDIDND